MVVAAAATSIMSLYGTPALADSHANGAATDSPGLLSGNNLQVPVDVPVNICGNTVDVIAALNPAFGGSCANGSGSHGKPHSSSEPSSSSETGNPGSGSDGGYGEDSSGGDGVVSGDSSAPRASSSATPAYGETHGSPGLLSGNNAQVPVDVPVNACGNSVDVIGVLSPVFGNECDNGVGYGDTPSTTPPKTPPTTTPSTPPTTTPETTPPSTPPTTPRVIPPGTPPMLPHTGSEGMLAASAASAALLVGGALLYRRGRAASHR